MKTDDHLNKYVETHENQSEASKCNTNMKINKKTFKIYTNRFESMKHKEPAKKLQQSLKKY